MAAPTPFPLSSHGRTAPAVVAVVFLLAACGGGGSTDPGDDDPGGSSNVTLTVTAKGMDAGYVPGVVYAYIGNNIETRLRMPLLIGENDAIVKPFGANEKTATLSVPKGKYVTLFAAEFGVVGTNVRPPGQSLSKIVPADQTEFTAWSGAAGRIITAEPGVASIRMDADASITAEFRKLEGITVQSQGCVSMAMGYQAPPPLGFGTTQGESRAATAFTGNPVSNSFEEDWYFVYGRQGTVYTFVAFAREDRSAGVQRAGFMNWGGSTSGTCGSNLTCVLTLPPRGTAGATLSGRYSYVFINNVNGCGSCLGVAGCVIRP